MITLLGMLSMIDAGTKLFALFGDPVGHSLSPLMHNRAFARVGYNGVYVAVRIADPVGAVAAMRALNMRGASVTIPHKLAVMEYLDEIAPEARQIGAVNTIVNDTGRLKGLNTDGAGAMDALRAQTAIQGRRVALVGAGGAARAIGYGILQEGGALTIYNRTQTNAEALAADLGAAWGALPDLARTAPDILINATSVGMHPQVEALPVNPDWLQPQMVVMDTVYNPLETRLLAAARARGCRTVTGEGMFIHQGALQFAAWTGQPAPLAEMRRVVLEALTQQ